MRYRTKRNLIRGLCWSFAFFILAYSLLETKDLIAGPKIIINYPKDGSLVKNNLVTVRGLAKNVSRLEINGQQMFTDTDGVFNQETPLSAGYNLIEIRATDKFDRIVKRKIELVSAVDESAPSPLVLINKKIGNQ